MFERYTFFEGLTSLLGSKRKLLINNAGQIKNLAGNDLPTEIDPEGYATVECDLWDGFRRYRVVDLVALQFKQIQIPEKHYGRVSGFVLDGNKDNTHASNVGYRFRDGPVGVDNFPGYFYVPGVPRLAIAKSGEAVDLVTGKRKSFYVTKYNPVKNIKGGYLFTGTLLPIEHKYIIARHRLLCLTFKDFPDNVEKMTVNHKDGVPGNDHLDNLEWATRGENNLHAYVNDLKQQHKRVLVRNVITKEVTEYYSICECARALGYATDETIRQRLVTSEFGTVFQEGNQVKYKDDPRDWIDPEDPVKAVEEAQQRVPVIAQNCLTGQIVLAPSAMEAGRMTGVNSKGVSERIYKCNKAPFFGWQFKKASDKEPFPPFTNEEYLASLVEGKLDVEARNILSGEIESFPSVRQAENKHGKNLSEALRLGKQPLCQDGWQFKYAKDDWVDYGNADEALYRRQKELMAKNEATGAVLVAEDSLQMAKMLGLVGGAVRIAALTRGNQVYSGYRFRLGVTSEPWPDTPIEFRFRSAKRLVASNQDKSV